jgi:hypothetical protein
MLRKYELRVGHVFSLDELIKERILSNMVVYCKRHTSLGSWRHHLHSLDLDLKSYRLSAGPRFLCFDQPVCGVAGGCEGCGGSGACWVMDLCRRRRLDS